MSISPPENAALEGVISFLASRPHSWGSWRVDSLRFFDRESTLLHEKLVLVIERNSEKISASFEGLNPSPSKLVQEALGAIHSSEEKLPKWLFEGLPSPWNSISSLSREELSNAEEYAIHEKRQFSQSAIRHFYLKYQ